MPIHIREMTLADAEIISNAFKAQGWNKPIELYLRYIDEQNKAERIVLIAESDGDFTGYVTIKWKAHYPFFAEQGIPEIADFNVLIRYRRKGIGSKLMDRAEDLIRERSPLVGIGVGLYPDYGAAQVMYVKRGYVPDGKGIYRDTIRVNYGDTITLDDSVVFHLIKRLT